MTEAETERLDRLLTGPVLRILHGVQERIKALSGEDLRLLMRHFDCGIEDLDHRIWDATKKTKRRST